MAANLALTKAAGVNCPKTGGVKRLFAIKTDDINTITLGTMAHDVTDLLFATSGKGFGELGFKRGECELTESMERSNTVEVNFSIPNPNAAQRFQLEQIRNACEQYYVAELYDDERLLFIGYDGTYQEEAFVSFTSAESTSGRAKDDDNLFSMTMTAEQGEFLRVLSGLSSVSATTNAAIIAELIAATNV